MASIKDFLGLTEINQKLDTINRKLDKIMATQSEAAAKLQAAADKIEKAKTEILAEIEKLKAGGELSPEAQAAVERLEALAQALDDIVPDVETRATGVSLPDKLVALAAKLEKTAAAWVMVNDQMQQAIAEIRAELEKIKAEE